MTLTKQFHRPQSLRLAARHNMTADFSALLDASLTRLHPAHGVRQEVARVEGRAPTIEEALSLIQVTLSPSEDQRRHALRLAADLRMAGVAGREVARAVGVSETQLSRMLSTYPEAKVTRAGDVVFDDAAGRWVTPDSAATTA